MPRRIILKTHAHRVGRPGLIEDEPDVVKWVFSFVAMRVGDVM